MCRIPEEKQRNAYNRYWEKVSKRMQKLYFWECRIKRRSTFEMSFDHNGTIVFPDFSKDDEMLIEFYASKNGLHIVDEHLNSTKSVYRFEKAVG